MCSTWAAVLYARHAEEASAMKARARKKEKRSAAQGSARQARLGGVWQITQQI
jgi:hypothetical protein